MFLRHLVSSNDEIDGFRTFGNVLATLLGKDQALKDLGNVLCHCAPSLIHLGKERVIASISKTWLQETAGVSRTLGKDRLFAQCRSKSKYHVPDEMRCRVLLSWAFACRLPFTSLQARLSSPCRHDRIHKLRKRLGSRSPDSRSRNRRLPRCLSRSPASHTTLERFSPRRAGRDRWWKMSKRAASSSRRQDPSRSCEARSIPRSVGSCRAASWSRNGRCRVRDVRLEGEHG
jgi:hypothetical protein